MGRIPLAMGVVVLALVAAPASPGVRPAPPATTARPFVHPMALTHVYYSFEVETEGLPRHSYHPPPRDIDVTFRNLRTGRLVTIEGVGPNWGRKFWRPRYGRGRLEAHAHGGGRIWCVVEVNRADHSGTVTSVAGRRRCRVKRRFGSPGEW